MTILDVKPARIARLAAGLVCLMLSAPTALADDDEADDVARAIYRQVERACPVGREGNPYNLAAVAARYFLPEVKEELSRAYASRALDFDILIDSRDCEIDDVDIDMKGDDDDDGPGRVVARAEFENFGERKVVDLLMVRTGRVWKVADIAYRHRNWQLMRDVGVRYSK